MSKINKKFILLGIILLIVAAIVIIALKGVNVSLLLRQHEEMNVFVGKQIEMNDIKDICKEVFGDKKFVLREVELFGNSFNVATESITDEEKSTLIEKINEKYETELTTDELTVSTISNVRVRDMVTPYLKPVIISTVLILAYIYIRFIKHNPIKILGKLCGLVILTEVLIFSVVTITRLPIAPSVFFIMAAIAILEVILFINKEENKLKIVEEK